MQYWKLVLSLLTEHSTSYVHYCSSYPCALAGMLHQDSVKVESSRVLFKAHVAAYKEALKFQTADVEALLRRHPFNSTAMQFCIKFAEATDFVYEGNAQWKEWLLVVFRGQTGTVMIEQSARVLRDHETRDSTNKSMQHISAWEFLMESKLLADFHLPEIEIGASCQPPPTFGESIFQFTRKVDEKLSDLDLDGILKTPDWPSYTAQSQKHVYGQLQALLFLSANNKFADAASLWFIKLVPPAA